MARPIDRQTDIRVLPKVILRLPAHVYAPVNDRINTPSQKLGYQVVCQIFNFVNICWPHFPVMGWGLMIFMIVS